MKANLQSLRGYMSFGWGRRFFNRWMKWIDRSGFPGGPDLKRIKEIRDEGFF